MGHLIPDSAVARYSAAPAPTTVAAVKSLRGQIAATQQQAEMAAS